MRHRDPILPKGQANIKGPEVPFVTFLYYYSPLDRMVFQDLLSTLLKYDGMLSQVMTKSVCQTHPQHTHTHTIKEATSHKQSMLYLLHLEIQEIHFQNDIHFNTLV